MRKDIAGGIEKDIPRRHIEDRDRHKALKYQRRKRHGDVRKERHLADLVSADRQNMNDGGNRGRI